MTWAAWGTLAALGVFHGANPGMGWLFAVALGMQEGRSRAVWQALPPIALGHALAVTAAVGLVLALGKVVPIETLKVITGAVLILFGLSRLVRMRHPRWASMRVGAAQLTLWSFLMASAHGAGLMVMPWVLPTATAGASSSAPTVAADEAHCHTAARELRTGAGRRDGVWHAAATVGIHTLAYFIAMTAVAWLVYAKLGVAILRKAWLNLDAVWAAALVVAGVVAWLG